MNHFFITSIKNSPKNHLSTNLVLQSTANNLSTNLTNLQYHYFITIDLSLMYGFVLVHAIGDLRRKKKCIIY